MIECGAIPKLTFIATLAGFFLRLQELEWVDAAESSTQDEKSKSK
jgi:hypothetical protein